jgi:hypothetical protein
MPVTRRHAGPAPHARAGFSLVEVLIGLTLAVGVSAILGSMLVFQSRSFARTQGATAVQRDLRMGLALLPMDLRAVSRSDRDLMVANATQIDLLANVGASIVCAVDGTLPAANAAAPLPNLTIVIPPTDVPPDRPTLTSFFTGPVVGDTVKVLIRGGMGGTTDRWLTAAITAIPAPVTAAGGLCSGAPFTDPSITPIGSLWPRPRWTLAWRGDVLASDLANLAPGAPIRVLRPVRYQLFQPASSAAGRWHLGYSEFSNGDWRALEPIAGPFDAAGAATGAGVGFTYYDTLGAVLPVGFDRSDVGRIDITLRPRTTVRGAARDSLVLRDSAVVRVSLRNRI